MAAEGDQNLAAARGQLPVMMRDVWCSGVVWVVVVNGYKRGWLGRYLVAAGWWDWDWGLGME